MRTGGSRTVPLVCQNCGLVKANATLRLLDGVREQEAKRIAGALHAEAGQLLAAVHLALDEISEDLDLSHREGICRVGQMLDRIEQQFREIAHELHTPVLGDLGLLSALELLARGMSGRSGVAITVAPYAGGRLPPLIETTIYRVAQEALNNVVAHAHATHAQIELRRLGRALLCKVSDDGVGFDVASTSSATGERKGLGLVGMSERLEALGGSLTIRSGAGGTTIVATLEEIADVDGNPARRRSRGRSTGPSGVARAARVRGGRRRV